LFSGLSSPRAWVGFRATSRDRIQRLVALVSSTGLGEVEIRRSTRDLHRRKGICQFKYPLLAKEFDVQVLENYGYEFYLGVYMPFSWPLAPKSEHAIVRESVNYIATIMTAYSAAVSKRRIVGPWNRPDKAVEEAAIRFVKVKLRADGYKVQSRETEICGYDLHATRDGQDLHVEVKGVSGDSPRFHISRTELKTAEQDPDWRLAVVLQAPTRPRMDSYISGKRVKRLFHMEPTQWFATTRKQ
jgi:hypothetical protein